MWVGGSSNAIIGQPFDVFRGEHGAPNRDLIDESIPIGLGAVANDKAVHPVQCARGGLHGRGRFIQHPINIEFKSRAIVPGKGDVLPFGGLGALM